MPETGILQGHPLGHHGGALGAHGGGFAGHDGSLSVFQRTLHLEIGRIARVVDGGGDLDPGRFAADVLLADPHAVRSKDQR